MVVLDLIEIKLDILQKKRSKKVWSNFYNLFPRLAIQDKWNGHTSI